MAVKTLELFTLVANYLDEVDKLDEVDIDEDVDTQTSNHFKINSCRKSHFVFSYRVNSPRV